MVFAVPLTVTVSVPVLPPWLSEIVPLVGGSFFTSNEKSSAAITLEHVGFPLTKVGCTPSPEGGPGLVVVVAGVCGEVFTVVPAGAEVVAFVDVPADPDVDVSADAPTVVWSSVVTGSGDVVADALPSTGVSVGEAVSDPVVGASVVAGVVLAWFATAISDAGPTVNANRKHNAAIARRLRRCRRGCRTGAAYAHPCSCLG